MHIDILNRKQKLYALYVIDKHDCEMTENSINQILLLLTTTKELR